MILLKETKNLIQQEKREKLWFKLGFGTVPRPRNRITVSFVLKSRHQGTESHTGTGPVRLTTQ